MDKFLLIEEYEFSNDLHTVWGKIYEVISTTSLNSNVKYKWEVSDYCQITGDASVYIPNGRYGNKISDVRVKLFGYADRFDKKVTSKQANSTF